MQIVSAWSNVQRNRREQRSSSRCEIVSLCRPLRDASTTVTDRRNVREMQRCTKSSLTSDDHSTMSSTRSAISHTDLDAHVIRSRYTLAQSHSDGSPEASATTHGHSVDRSAVLTSRCRNGLFSAVLSCYLEDGVALATSTQAVRPNALSMLDNYSDNMVRTCQWHHPGWSTNNGWCSGVSELRFGVAQGSILRFCDALVDNFS
jgi:hypothetical protein